LITGKRCTILRENRIIKIERVKNKEGIMRLSLRRAITFITVFLMVLAAISACAPASPNQQPVEVVSVSGPIPPYNPGGPVVEITLKNASDEAITSLAATLKLSRDFDFAYDVTSSKPLSPGNSIIARLTLINGGFSDNTTYPLIINGTQQSGATFSYTKQVQIEEPQG
jgi:hypothetical protein